MVNKLLRNKVGIIVGIIFIIIFFYVNVNKGDLPSIFVEETEFGGDTTILGKILLVITFPFAILGLTIEGIVSNNVFLLLVMLAEFIYGFAIVLVIQKLFKKW